MKKILLTLLLILPLAMQAQVIVTVAGDSTAGFAGDGFPAVDAELHYPYAVYKSNKGDLYIYDNMNVRLRKVDTAGIITTICGNGMAGYAGDGFLAIYAEIEGDIDFAMDTVGNLFFSDRYCNCIRKIDTSGIINTVIGGVGGYSGDGHHADSAELRGQTGIVFDKKGNLYIEDYLNYCIRKVDTAGIITTIAGTGVSGFSPDGSRADTAHLSGGINIRINKEGNLCFWDNNRIRCIDSSGYLTTIAGTGILGYSGDSGLATNAEIGGAIIAFDTTGNLFIADENSNTIRKVSTSGIITVVAGSPTSVSTYGGDGGNPLLAKLCEPAGLAVDMQGNIYIGDLCNSRVREVTLDTPASLKINVIKLHEEKLSISPNPCAGDFIASLSSNANEDYIITITDILGTASRKYQSTTNKQTTIHTDLPAGIYFITAITSQSRFTQKLIIL